MKLNNGNEISFFKILFSESAEYIQVPSPFGKKCFEKGNNKKKLQTVILKTRSRNVADEWNVQFLKTKDGYYFADGWLKFKKDNHLQEIEFLVFFLRSRSPKLTIEVFSYATNGCLKSLLSRSNKFPKAKTGIGCDDSLKTDGQNLLERAIKKSCLNQVPLTKGFVKAVGIQGLCELKLENDEGKIWPADLKNWGKLIKVPYIATGWADFMKDNKLKIGNRCLFSHVKDNIIHVHVIKRTKARKRFREPSTSRNAGSSDGNELSIEEIEVSDNDSLKNVESPLILKKVVKKSYMKQMLLSRGFVEAAGIGGYIFLQLENDEGKKWEVSLKKRGWDDFPYIVGGWSKFVKDNKVKVGNSCDIYHVKDNVLRVHVYKKRGGPFSKKKPRITSQIDEVSNDD